MDAYGVSQELAIEKVSSRNLGIKNPNSKIT